MTLLAGMAIAVLVFGAVCVVGLIALVVMDSIIRPTVRGMYDPEEGA
jgi:hypothetical protein